MDQQSTHHQTSLAPGERCFPEASYNQSPPVPPPTLISVSAPERKRSLQPSEEMPLPPSHQTVPHFSQPLSQHHHYHRNEFTGNGSDVPTISVSPYKVRRLGEFDQDTVSQLAEQLKDWLDNQTRVSQGMFAQRVLSRSQGTLSLLLTRKTPPISSTGEEVWRKIRDFLHDEQQQRDLVQYAYQS